MYNPLIIVGDSAFAQVAYEYFTHDSSYDVVAFSVERNFLKNKSLFGLPVHALEDLERSCDAGTHSFYVATTYTQLNRLRTRLYLSCRKKGFKPASYISKNAFIWKNCKIGEHCFIFENNVVQPFAEIGSNVVLWSGNHVGHHSVIGSNCFISSHVVISGYCEIGENCFFGVNSCVADKVTIGRDCVVGIGAVLTRNTDSGLIYRGNPASPAKVDSLTLFKAGDEAGTSRKA